MAPVQGVDGQVKPFSNNEHMSYREISKNNKWNEAPSFRESGFPVPNKGVLYRNNIILYNLIMILTYGGWTHSSFTGGVITTTKTWNEQNAKV